eukprot:TRINITY_DN6699_c0_g1_i2.p1 TRINITY_DN6699_c0_g1~~TRINITY_DN6699_c0_g1_i2.p1  ORF type:complete len:356 (+),score=55.06 TRINITY_DN6699_c0_g1_i2:768-1835(+)
MTARFEIQLACAKLMTMDIASSSDPRVSVWLLDPTSGDDEDMIFVGQTEVIKDDENPHFEAQITVEYSVDADEDVIFRVDDINDGDSDEDGTFLGQASIKAHELARAAPTETTIECKLVNKKWGGKRGTLFVTPREVVVPVGGIEISVRCEKLEKKDLLGKSDPYLLFHAGATAQSSVFLRSNILKNTLNPDFGVLNWGYAAAELPLYVECWDWNKIQKHELIGACTVSAKQLLETCIDGKELSLPLINPKKQGKSKKYVDFGKIIFSNAVETGKLPQFILDCVARKECTFTVTKEDYALQRVWRCRDCELEDNEGCCEVCKDACHAGHDVFFDTTGRFFCDCPKRGKCKICEYH